jgi:hypothetical protein
MSSVPPPGPPVGGAGAGPPGAGTPGPVGPPPPFPTASPAPTPPPAASPTPPLFLPPDPGPTFDGGAPPFGPGVGGGQAYGAANYGAGAPPQGSPGGGWPRSAVAAVVVLALLAAGAGAVAATRGAGGDDGELEALRAELEDTEDDYRGQLATLESERDEARTSLEAAQGELDELGGAFPATVDTIRNSGIDGTWELAADFFDCTGIEGGPDACRAIGGGELGLDLELGFDGDFSGSSSRLSDVAVTRDPAYTYKVDSIPDPDVFGEFTCGDTPSLQELTMTFTVTEASFDAGGWIAGRLAGEMTLTVTSVAPECSTSTLSYTFEGTPTG